MKFGKRQAKRVMAFANREIKLKARYKWSFFSRVLILPLLHTVPLIILYWGLTALTGADIPGVTENNYLTWVLLGSVFYSTFLLGYQAFRVRFWEEKYWMTIYGTLIAPVSKYYLLFGVVIELALEGLVMSIPFIVMSYIMMPISIMNFLFIYLIFLITLIASAGISLVNGTFYLINENLATLFEYILFFFVFLSTYAIPYQIYPDFLHFFININPLYHFIQIAREVWLVGFSLEILWSLLYVIGFCVVCVVIGIYFFTKTTRRFGVRGY